LAIPAILAILAILAIATMRVIAGSLKGRRLESPDWPGLRPTSDKLRETLFNVLMSRIEGARVLDGYAGTGALGIEALSRGAAHVTFVESNPRAVRLIERNLGRCAVTDRYAIIRARFADAASRLPAETIDLVLLDPPYGPDDLTGALKAAAPLVAADGLLVIEHARRDEAPADEASITKVRDIVAGDSTLSLYRVRGEQRAGAL
jgi:16S rRNA (guanine966-N2)-methyltransferase